MERTIISATAEYETATELLAAYMGDLNTRRHAERKSDHPSMVVIEHLSSLMQQAKRDRDLMDPDRPDEVRRLIRLYTSKRENLQEATFELQS